MQIHFPNAPIAIAVSGGADSMALLLLARQYAPGKITALTVDHALRAEAKEEALQVQSWCRNLGIPHHTLEWKPTSSLQEAARDARYELLTGWCKKNNVEYLLTAHHRGDQAETLFFRLARGSHLRGLACIQPETEMHDVRIVRPLLDVGKKELIDYLQKNNQPWIEDPSNRNMGYTRNALRAQLQSLANYDDIERRAAEVARFFGQLRHRLDERTSNAMRAAVTLHDNGARLSSDAYAALPPEIALELLARLICTLTGDDHPPRSEKLRRLHRWCLAPDAGPAQLAHLAFAYEKNQGIISVYPSPRP